MSIARSSQLESAQRCTDVDSPAQPRPFESTASSQLRKGCTRHPVTSSCQCDSHQTGFATRTYQLAPKFHNLIQDLVHDHVKRVLDRGQGQYIIGLGHYLHTHVFGISWIE